MKKFEVRRFGSFWAGDLTRTDDRPALYTKNNILRFGDSTVDESVNIPWVWVGDKWISKATVLTNITWNELDAFGFTRGRPVRIDGDLYYCRCPHLDVNPDSCEFRQAVNESGQGNEFWTWQGHYFMGDRTIGMEDNKGTVHPLLLDGRYAPISVQSGVHGLFGAELLRRLPACPGTAVSKEPGPGRPRCHRLD